MNVLVVNCGSSSLKYQLLDMTTETELAKGLFEKIGDQDAIFTHKRPNADKLERVEPILNHKEALRILLDILVDAEFGVISSMDEIDAVGHRVSRSDRIAGLIDIVVHPRRIGIDNTEVDFGKRTSNRLEIHRRRRCVVIELGRHASQGVDGPHLVAVDSQLRAVSGGGVKNAVGPERQTLEFIFRHALYADVDD